MIKQFYSIDTWNGDGTVVKILSLASNEACLVPFHLLVVRSRTCLASLLIANTKQFYSIDTPGTETGRSGAETERSGTETLAVPQSLLAPV